jgi:hypothetical protein
MESEISSEEPTQNGMFPRDPQAGSSCTRLEYLQQKYGDGSHGVSDHDAGISRYQSASVKRMLETVKTKKRKPYEMDENQMMSGSIPKKLISASNE